MSPVRVLLVDDEELVRTGLRLILGSDPGVEVVGEAGDGATALRMLGEVTPDVLVMDIRMPVMDGLEALRRVRAQHPTLPVLMLTTFDTDDMVLTALTQGATGFLLKSTAPEDLVRAVRAAAEGEAILSPSVTAQLIAAVTRSVPRSSAPGARSRLATLSEREREVADAVAQGMSNAEIATTLFMGLSTVKTHVGHLFEKLGVENRVQVALLVRDARDE